MQEIFSIKNIIIYLLIINLISLIAMFIDKRQAKKGRRRIPENTLFTFVVLGGGIGGIIGMYWFRHKTKKVKFVLGFPAILILQIIAIIIVMI